MLEKGDTYNFTNRNASHLPLPPHHCFQLRRYRLLSCGKEWRHLYNIDILITIIFMTNPFMFLYNYSMCRSNLKSCKLEVPLINNLLLYVFLLHFVFIPLIS